MHDNPRNSECKNGESDSTSFAMSSEAACLAHLSVNECMREQRYIDDVIQYKDWKAPSSRAGAAWVWSEYLNLQACRKLQPRSAYLGIFKLSRDAFSSAHAEDSGTEIQRFYHCAISHSI
jgi:hypothetical protein